MLDLIEFICGIFDFLTAWRFYVCLILALAMVGLIYWLVPDPGLRLPVSIPVVVVGIGSGLFWQWRNR